MKCPHCKCEANTVFTATKGRHHYNNFCTTCHRTGQPANSRIGAQYNFTDKPTTMLPPIYDWENKCPEIFGYDAKCFGRV